MPRTPHFNAELVPAMITPFKKDGSLDLDRAAKLATYLADNGCDGILVNGTTGESPTMSFDEKRDLIQAVRDVLKGKIVNGKSVQLMAGVGSNDTQKCAAEAEKTAALGVDALLSVVPYYNKPSQKGMIAHFERIAGAVDTEVVIYNIPSRSVVLMSPDTMATLHARCPNIIGVKQSHPDMDQVSEITAKLPKESWLTWCGDDSLTVPMIACGAHGTISVVAHLTGLLMREMIQAAKAGNRERALELHVKQLNLSRDIFFLPNPTVIKTCMSRLGFVEPVLREPMVWPDEAEQARIDQIMADYEALSPQRV